MNPKNVPDKYKSFATKCMDGIENYTDYDINQRLKYWNNFTEKDARTTGYKIDKYVKGSAFSLRKVKEFCGKLDCVIGDFVDKFQNKTEIS